MSQCLGFRGQGRGQLTPRGAKSEVSESVSLSGHSDWPKGLKISVSGCEEKRRLRSQMSFVSQVIISRLYRTKCFICPRFHVV